MLVSQLWTDAQIVWLKTEKILQMSLRMQLTGCLNNLWDLKIIFKKKHLLITWYILLTTLAQTVVFKYGRDPSSIFKEAVDGLFQQFLEALNLGNDIPCFLMTKSTHLTIVDWCTISWLQLLEGSFMPLEGCTWPAVPTFSESSEPFEWLTMPSYNMIYSLDNWRLANKLLNSNMEKILQAYSRM